MVQPPVTFSVKTWCMKRNEAQTQTHQRYSGNQGQKRTGTNWTVAASPLANIPYLRGPFPYDRPKSASAVKRQAVIWHGMATEQNPGDSQRAQRIGSHVPKIPTSSGMFGSLQFQSPQYQSACLFKPHCVSFTQTVSVLRNEGRCRIRTCLKIGHEMDQLS